MTWNDELKAKGYAGYPVTRKFIDDLEEATTRNEMFVTSSAALYKKMTLLAAGYLDEVAHAGACSPHELLPEGMPTAIAKGLGGSIDDDDTMDKVDDLALEMVSIILRDFVLTIGLCDLDEDGYPKF